MTLYRRLRIRLCDSILALHETEPVTIAYGLDVCRCKFCGRYYAVDTFRQIVHDVEDAGC